MVYLNSMLWQWEHGNKNIFIVVGLHIMSIIINKIHMNFFVGLIWERESTWILLFFTCSSEPYFFFKVHFSMLESAVNFKLSDYLFANKESGEQRRKICITPENCTNEPFLSTSAVYFFSLLWEKVIKNDDQKLAFEDPLCNPCSDIPVPSLAISVQTFMKVCRNMHGGDMEEHGGEPCSSRNVCVQHLK